MTPLRFLDGLDECRAAVHHVVGKQALIEVTEHGAGRQLGAGIAILIAGFGGMDRALLMPPLLSGVDEAVVPTRWSRTA